MKKKLLFFALSLSTTFSYGQVPVREEPRHHLVFENEFLRILDVNLPPEDTTLFHLHNTPSVFVFLSHTTVFSQLYGHEPVKSTSEKNSIDYDRLDTPRIHRVWNIDTSWLHVMDIELTSTHAQASPDEISDQLFRKLFNEKLANGYTCRLRKNEKIDLLRTGNGYLIISLSSSDLSIHTASNLSFRKMKPGHYIWVNKEDSISIKSINGHSEFLILQIK